MIRLSQESSIEIQKDGNRCVDGKSEIVISDNCCVDEVGEMVQKLVRVFQLFERDQIKIYGFTSSQCYSLIEILKADRLTMNELSDKMNLDSSTMTRIIDKLVRDGLIKRDKDEEDRRKVLVMLTDRGKEVANMLNDSVNEYYKKIISNIPTGRIDEVLNAVSVLLKAFEKANPNCC
ncbi:MarR family winged helix-turn-helix transcriptional regulator [Fervidicella metallireducens]|nr:MarR family transcriptional regulator [Fervidicella metallireducens]